MTLARSIRRLVSNLPLWLIPAVVGCGYSLRPPVEPSVRTVYVPVFQSTVFQRDLNLKLTEAVQKEIERRTPFKVVGSPDEADTTLSGQIFFADKNVVLEDPNNLPRQLTANLNVYVRWVDNRSGSVRQTDNLTAVFESVNFYPELGETAQATGYQKVIDKLAQDIVNMMEVPW
jgi:hypothetical protein